MRCESCGTENDDSFKFCMGCGKPLAAASTTTEAPTDASATTWSVAPSAGDASATWGASPDAGTTDAAASSEVPPASSVHDPGIDPPIAAETAYETMHVDGPPPTIAAPQPDLDDVAPSTPAPGAWGDSTPPPPAVAAPQGGLTSPDLPPPPTDAPALPPPPAWGAPPPAPGEPPAPSAWDAAGAVPPPPTAPPAWGQEPPPPSTPPAWGAPPATPPPPAPAWGQAPPAPQGPAAQIWNPPGPQQTPGWGQAPPAAAPVAPADPNGLGAAVQRTGTKAQKVSRTAFAVAGAVLDDGEVVEAAVAGKLEGHGAVMVLTNRALRLVDDRQWKPVTERYELDGNLQVQGWQDERTASLTLVVAGRQLVLDQVLDRPLAVEMAQRIRYRTGG